MAKNTALDHCDVDYFDPQKIRQLERRFKNDRSGETLAGIFKILSDPTRIRIVRALSEMELCVCDLAAFLKLTKSAVSHQLRLLRERRIVKYRRDGKMAYYSLDDAHVRDLLLQAEAHAGEVR